MEKRYELIECKLPAAGLDDYIIGTVTFGYKLGSWDKPVEITRYVPPKDNAPQGIKGVDYPVADIIGASSVKVYDAFVCVSKKGDTYLQTGSVNVPRDIKNAVAMEAAGRLGTLTQRAARQAPQAAIDDVFPDGDEADAAASALPT